MGESATIERNSALAIALRLEIVTIIWMVIETAAVIGAGIAARSLLLVAFGIDSAIELASAVVVFRRLRIEKFAGDFDDAKAIERKTAKVAGYLLLLLSAYVLLQAGFGPVTHHAAETSPVGIAVAVIAAFAMPFLAKAKLRIADRIDSRSLHSDAIETFTCAYLSWVVLAGLILNELTRWWWIEPIASSRRLGSVLRPEVC